MVAKSHCYNSMAWRQRVLTFENLHLYSSCSWITAVAASMWGTGGSKLHLLLKQAHSSQAKSHWEIASDLNDSYQIPSGLRIVAVKLLRVRRNCLPASLPKPPISSASSATTFPSWSSTVYLLACSKPSMTVPLKKEAGDYFTSIQHFNSLFEKSMSERCDRNLGLFDCNR